MTDQEIIFKGLLCVFIKIKVATQFINQLIKKGPQFTTQIKTDPRKRQKSADQNRSEE
jgi:hypothetical protein